MSKTEDKIIIVEGCDLAGKTTMIDLISKRYQGIVIKNTIRPKDGSEVERARIKFVYNKILSFIADAPFDTFILDRFYPSELVYSKVKRNYEAFADADYVSLEERIKSIVKPENAFVILCSPPIKTILDRLKDRGDDYINKNDVEGILARYREYAGGTRLNVLEIDTRRPKEELLEDVVKFVEHEYKGNNKPKQRSLFGR